METINISKIKVENGFNSRRNFDESKLNELSDSIKKHGIIQPIVVRKKGKSFSVVAGERRLRASKIAKLKEIPCIIRELDDNEALQIMTIENLQRKNLHPMEEANGIDRLIKAGLSQSEISKELGVSAAFVSQRNSLNFLIDEFRFHFEKDLIKTASALALSKLHKTSQRQLLEQLTEWDFFHQDRAISTQQINSAIERLSVDLDNAYFDTTDESLLDEVGSCTNCTKKSCLTKDLFNTNNRQLCLDSKCFETKTKASENRFLEQAKKTAKTQKLVDLSDTYYKDFSSALSKNEYTVITEDSEIGDDVEIHKGVLVDGENGGKIVDFIYKSNNGSISGPMTEEQKKARKELIRKNKITAQTKRLAVSALTDEYFEEFEKEGSFNDVFINYLLERIIGYGHSKTFIEYFTNRYDWKHEVDMNDYSNRSQQIFNNINEMPNKLKFKLFIDATLLFTTVSEYNNDTLDLLAKSHLIDEKEIQKEATRIVDKTPKPKKLIEII
tara:strand:- start:2308 stop:3804 length:1497 start_codon:yes stop_codon:yes gene_type:complete